MIKGFYKEKINGEIVICRSRENVKNMFVEFQEYLNYFTGSKFNPDDYITRKRLIVKPALCIQKPDYSDIGHCWVDSTEMYSL